MSPLFYTDPLKKAATAAKTEDEAYLCRYLAHAISDGSPYAWKLFYSAEASERLSKESCEALEKVMQDAERIYRTPPCRGPLPRLAKTASASQKAKQGISIRDSWSGKGKKKKTPVVGKGKSKVFEKPPQIAYDAIQDPKLPWEGVCIANDTPEDSSKISDMYIEGIDGQFGLAKVCKKKLTYNPFNFSAYISSVTEANNETCASSANEYHNDGASSDDSDVLC